MTSTPPSVTHTLGHATVSRAHYRIDFADINSRALAALPALATRRLRDGRREGTERAVLNPKPELQSHPQRRHATKGTREVP